MNDKEMLYEIKMSYDEKEHLEWLIQKAEENERLLRNLTNLDLDNQKYKDIAREHYKQFLREERKVIKLEIELEHQKKVNEELNTQNIALILERNGLI